jgi:hypothetical protein
MISTSPFHGNRTSAFPLLPVAAALAFLIVPVLAGCGTQGDGGTSGQVPAATPSPSSPQPSATDTPGTSGSGSYPKEGHAPDYSWIAGQVQFTRIQGGCIFVRTDEAADVPTPEASGADTPGAGGTIGTPVVGTAVAGDTSPPLREITPSPPSSNIPQGAPGVYVPGGPGWDLAHLKDGDYVVLFGHPNRPGEPYEICPGGTPYVVDKLMLNN